MSCNDLLLALHSQWSDCQNADFGLFESIKCTNLDIKDAGCLLKSISCTVQHLAHQQSQQTIQQQMLRKRTFCLYLQANMANQPRAPHDNIIKRMKASVAWRLQASEPLEHCAAFYPKRGFQWGINEKCTFEATTRQRNASRIMWIERLLWQQSELKTQRPQLSRNRKIREMLKRRD